MPRLMTTDTVEPAQRPGYWVDMICSTYVELECDPVAEPGFHGHIVNHALPGLDLSVVNSCPQSVRRTPGAISRAQSDYFIVSLQTRGHGVIAQDGREAHLGPGDFALYDSTRPYTLHFEGAFEEIVLKLPRDRLCAQVQGMNHLTASKVSGQVGAGHLLINMINTLRQEADSLAPASAAAVASGVVSLLVAGIQSLSACTQVMPSALHAYHIMRIKKYLDTHLRDPQLSVESVAQTLGMSPGHLHRLFKDEALSPAQYLWHQRLELCGQELLNPRRARTSISAIAYECGFSDAAHFSRSFRSRFGCSPKEWRHANREHLNS